MPISFSSYDVSYNIPDEATIESWILEVVENEGYKVGHLNFIFCSNEYILINNKQFLSHNYTTDIITFDYTYRRIISGDILISIPTVHDNSIKFECRFFDELLRVIIHGVLHLLGYSDSTTEEKALMRKAEDLALLYYETNFK